MVSETKARYAAEFGWKEKGGRYFIKGDDAPSPIVAYERLVGAIVWYRMKGKMNLWNWLRFGRQLRRAGLQFGEQLDVQPIRPKVQDPMKKPPSFRP